MNEKYPLPQRARITALHRELRRDVHIFQSQMHLAESRVPNEVDMTPGPASTSLLELVEARQESQMYSRAVQVFALLAIEVFLNEYGYLRLGEELFEKKFESLSVGKKPSALLTAVTGVPSTNHSEMIAIVRRLSEKRNGLVHPRPELETWNDDGTVTEQGKRLPSVDVGAADAAVQDMERFFELFKSDDPEAAFVLGEV